MKPKYRLRIDVETDGRIIAELDKGPLTTVVCYGNSIREAVHRVWILWHTFSE